MMTGINESKLEQNIYLTNVNVNSTVTQINNGITINLFVSTNIPKNIILLQVLAKMVNI